MRTYLAFYKGQQKVVIGATSWAAQLAAAKAFGVKKSYEVTVMLCDTDIDTASI